MRSQLSRQLRSNSNPLSSVPPAPNSSEYSTSLANTAARILYRSPLPSQKDLPIYILNSWAFPDASTTNYDTLLPYVLARLPDDDELIGGLGYEIVFFAGGGGGDEATQTKKSRPGWGWFLQAYHVLTRATRKRLQKLYIVHEKKWIKVLVETFASIVSPKFRKKIIHVSTISGLALHMPIEDLLIPPTAYLSDRRKSPHIYAPHISGRRAFGVKVPLPTSADGSPRLPRVLREATSFLLLDENIKIEGIFRVSARAQTVEILREAYDRGQKFIVWREREAVLASSYRKEGTGDVWVEELDQTEGYELHAAAALIKLWYKELREPIFPPWSYQALDKFYSAPDISLDPPQLLAILSMEDEWSPITNKMSRQVLTMHLVPLLSRVAEFSDWNQMTPENLVTCFAPSLLRGPDPIEDLKMSGIVRRILVALITRWKHDLAPLLNTSFEAYEESLRMPEAVEDREDPLEEEQTNDTSELEMQTSGITLLDNEDSDEEIEGSPPPLPPRPVASGTAQNSPSGIPAITESQPNGINPADATRSHSSSPVESGPPNGSGPLRRKPAPALMPLPRYSTIIHDRPAVLQDLQYYNTVAPEGEELGEDANLNRLPLYEKGMPMNEDSAPIMPPRPSPIDGAAAAAAGSSIQRKPVPKMADGA